MLDYFIVVLRAASKLAALPQFPHCQLRRWISFAEGYKQLVRYRSAFLYRSPQVTDNAAKDTVLLPYDTLNL